MAGLLKKLFGKKKEKSVEHLGPEPGPYFQVDLPSLPQYLCSDDSCPCPGTERLIPGNTGFMFISEELVQLRADTLTSDAFRRKTENLAKAQGVALVYLGAGVHQPLFMCELAAKQRGLDLTVAAADAAYLFQHGWCPLRPTPRQEPNPSPKPVNMVNQIPPQASSFRCARGHTKLNFGCPECKRAAFPNEP
jgi:hypothetical protein